MKLIFYDLMGWDYDASSPQKMPMGGTQSALCYLAARLARRGHDVSILCGVPEPREALGVRCYPISKIPPSLVTDPADAVIVLSGPAEVVLTLRQHAAAQTPIVLWSHIAVDLPIMHALRDKVICNAWNEIVCVSDWHRQTFLHNYPLAPDKVQVLRNAISPGFEQMFSCPEEVAAAKADRCLLAYTSDPSRGLEYLLELFPAIHREFPETELHVYSSKKVYHVHKEKDQYLLGLYEKCKHLNGVRYEGSLPQPELARTLRETAVLSYANNFAETSSIAVMEALAAGAFVVTSQLGVLPETLLGFGELVPADSTQRRYITAYTEALRGVLARRRRDPVAFSQERFEQTRQINASCTWETRVFEWEQAIQTWKQRRKEQLASV